MSTSSQLTNAPKVQVDLPEDTDVKMEQTETERTDLPEDPNVPMDQAELPEDRTDSKVQEPEQKENDSQEPGSEYQDHPLVCRHLTDERLLALLASVIEQLQTRPPIRYPVWFGYMNKNPATLDVVINGFTSPGHVLPPHELLRPVRVVFEDLLIKKKGNGEFKFLSGEDFDKREVKEFFSQIFTRKIVTDLNFNAWCSKSVPAYSKDKHVGVENWHQIHWELLRSIVMALVVYNPKRWPDMTEMPANMQNMMLLAVVLASTLTGKYGCKGGTKSVQDYCKALLHKMHPEFGTKSILEVLPELANLANVYVRSNQVKFQLGKAKLEEQQARAAAEAARAAAEAKAVIEAAEEEEAKLQAIADVRFATEKKSFLQGLGPEQYAFFLAWQQKLGQTAVCEDDQSANGSDSDESAADSSGSDAEPEKSETEPKQKSKRGKQEVCDKDNNVHHTAPGAKPDAAAEMKTGTASETEPSGADGDTVLADLPRGSKRKTCGGGNDQPRTKPRTGDVDSVTELVCVHINETQDGSQSQVTVLPTTLGAQDRLTVAGNSALADIVAGSSQNHVEDEHTPAKSQCHEDAGTFYVGTPDPLTPVLLDTDC